MIKRENSRMISFLAALCLFLSAVEYAIPKPLPFLRIGLANLPVIIGLNILSAGEIFLLVLLKIAGQGFIAGTFFSYIFLFSAGGSLASGLAMFAAYKLFKKNISCIGISLAGAAASNLTQLAIARTILFGEGTKYIAPILLISGGATGLLLGIFAENFKIKSKWLASLTENGNG